FTENNLGPGALRKFAVATDKISVQVRFDYVFDFETVRPGFFDVLVYIALRINHRSFSFRTDHVGSMGQAGKIKLFEVHHRSSIPELTRKVWPSGWRMWHSRTPQASSVGGIVAIRPRSKAS